MIKCVKSTRDILAKSAKLFNMSEIEQKLWHSMMEKFNTAAFRTTNTSRKLTVSHCGLHFLTTKKLNLKICLCIKKYFFCHQKNVCLLLFSSPFKLLIIHFIYSFLIQDNIHKNRKKRNKNCKRLLIIYYIRFLLLLFFR